MGLGELVDVVEGGGEEKFIAAEAKEGGASRDEKERAHQGLGAHASRLEGDEFPVGIQSGENFDCRDQESKRNEEISSLDELECVVGEHLRKLDLFVLDEVSHVGRVIDEGVEQEEAAEKEKEH